jgi:hypothetical protein
VALGSLAALSTGTDEMAARVAHENVGRGLSRMGESHIKGMGYLADATDAASLVTAYKEAKNAIVHQAKIEQAVVRSASILWTNVAEGQKKVAPFGPLIDRRATALLDEVKAAYQLQAVQRGVAGTEPVRTAEEKEAAATVVDVVTAGGRGGAAGGRGAGAGGGRGGAAQGPRLPDEFNAEFTQLLRKKLTALEIRDFLSGEFTPLPLAEVMAVLKAREAAGQITLTRK